MRGPRKTGVGGRACLLRVLPLATVAALATAGCTRSPEATATAATTERFALGHAATPAQIAAWNLDASPDGAGLPPGRGSAAEGGVIFAQKCAVCHGAKGQGQAIYPQLIGREPREGFPFGKDPKIPRTIGNYWPYATTVFDYVRRAMPFPAPGSLTPNEAYAVTAYLLAQNEVVPANAVMDATTLPKVRMPARDRFVPDNRRGGPEIR